MIVWVIQLFAFIVEGFFTIILASCLYCALDRAASNVTQIDRFKQSESEEIGTMEACRHVFGDGTLLCWLFPFAAFPDDFAIV
jgi:hypothetical protein